MSDKFKKFERGVPRIVCAANKCLDAEGNEHVVIGARHYCPTMNKNYDALEALVGKVKSNIYEQGFIDQFGTWYNREDAWVIAKANDQIVWLCGGQRLEDDCDLYSENLY